MKFNIGDKVMLKKDIVVKDRSGDVTCVLDTNNYQGEIYVITRVYEPAKYYHINKHSEFIFEEEMLEPVEYDCYNCGNKGLIEICEQCLTNTNDKPPIPSCWKEKAEEIKTYPKYPKVEKFKQLQQEELKLYELKNAKYGDSFGLSVQKYGLISALTRMSDKWNRIENLILNHDSGTDDESLIDSLMDLANYCNMTIVELEDKQ